MKIKNKTAVITGGASGLGEACARRLSGEGAKIVIMDLDQERGNALAAQLGGQCAFMPTDICSSEDIAKALDHTIAKFGQMDIVINCAGVASGMKTASRRSPHDLDHFRKVINTNLVGIFDVMRQAAFRMLTNVLNDEDGRGVMINTASIAAFDGQIGQAAYAASKGGIVGMTLPIARECAEYGIRVVTIAPGLFETPLMANMPPAVKESMAQGVPFPRRLGKPVEFARMVMHVIENTMLNGCCIRIDGALRMSPK